MGDRVFYVNYLWDITPQPEYYPFSEAPLLTNLGFMASHDPVALDAATFAIIQERASDASRINKSAFEDVLQRAESMGLGKQGKGPDHLS